MSTLLACAPAFAQTDATWAGSTSSEWNTTTNWNPNIVPDNDAIFTAVGADVVTNSGTVNINQVLFQTGAKGFSVTNNGLSFFNINGAGIINNSITQQNIVNNGSISFNNAATISGGVGGVQLLNNGSSISL